MLSEIEKHGGRSICDDDGDYRAEYRGFYLMFTYEHLHVARVDDWDRWANSRIAMIDVPTTIEELDALLDTLAEDS